MNYPTVKNEFETMRQVAAGRSLARFGDGELKMIFGQGYVREAPNLAMSTELFKVLNEPPKNCIVGIPTMDPKGPKHESWIRHQSRFERVLQGKFQYHSAFVTRPDSAPWIECDEYYELVTSIWRDKHAVILCEPDNKMRKFIARTSAKATWLECPSHGAYALIDQFMQQILKLKPDVAVLCAGPTATCLAPRLCREGQHAIDFGSAGGMFARLSKGKK